MSLSPQSIVYQQAHISDNRQGDVILAATICLFAAYSATLLRFIARRLAKAPLMTDDWMLVLGLFFTTATTADALLSLRYGLGKHFILVTDPVSYAKNSVAEGVLYNPAICFIKLSILFLYKRIFPTRRFRYLLYGVGVVVLCFNIAAALISIFQCLPIEANWDPSIPHTCIDISVAYTTGGSINAVLDAAILVIPVPQIWHLNLARARKIQVLGMFLTGGLVTTFSIVRVVYLSKIDIEDGTWTEVDGFIWTVAEMCGAVVSACLPTLRPLVTWGKQMSILSSRSRSTQNSNSYAMNDYPRPGPRVVRQNSLSLSRASRGGGFQVLEEHVK